MSRVHRVLHIMYEYGTCGVGGAAAAASRCHHDMLSRGIDSRVICCWVGECAEVLGGGVSGRDVLCLRTWWWWMGVRVLHALTGRWTHAIGLPGFKRVVRRFGPEEIHIHWMRRDVISWSQLKWLNSWIQQKPGAKLFVHLHDLWPLHQKEIVSLNPTFIVYSDFVANVASGKRYKTERRELVLASAFTSRVGREPSCQSIDGSVKVILFGCKDGRSNPDKGFADLEEALSLLPAMLKSKIVLKIFGETAPDCVTSGVKTVFLGRINDFTRLRDIYQSATCFAFPSSSETMGMTKLEALACGCPVIAFDRMACAEGVEHKKTGYIARDGDVADYAEGLKWALFCGV